mmetsp:Transcript_11057/g.27417  ORF Transcript_11057/g.27417 Transcript_11057/m.27417 type:complete len:81 (+) Transcript_11057:1100-1342(+)
MALGVSTDVYVRTRLIASRKLMQGNEPYANACELLPRRWPHGRNPPHFDGLWHVAKATRQFEQSVVKLYRQVVRLHVERN